eukprot:TRINITY_DN11320_c2_g1_i1.p1 TRINITY_DN11320_c2_g1~~TRINITY_DN11320_c2_g1_i1.p1  ORF type:complete len:280 (-),score=16.42 TRINITY_DN11320_c2_g1_i1:79-858(-)
MPVLSEALLPTTRDGSQDWVFMHGSRQAGSVMAPLSCCGLREGSRNGDGACAGVSSPSAIQASCSGGRHEVRSLAFLGAVPDRGLSRGSAASFLLLERRLCTAFGLGHSDDDVGDQAQGSGEQGLPSAIPDVEDDAEGIPRDRDGVLRCCNKDRGGLFMLCDSKQCPEDPRFAIRRSGKLRRSSKLAGKSTLGVKANPNRCVDHNGMRPPRPPYQTDIKISHDVNLCSAQPSNLMRETRFADALASVRKTSHHKLDYHI